MLLAPACFQLAAHLEAAAMPLLFAMLFMTTAGALLCVHSTNSGHLIAAFGGAPNGPVFAYAAALSAGLAIFILSTTSAAPAKARSFAGRCATLGVVCVAMTGVLAVQTNRSALEHSAHRMMAAWTSPTTPSVASRSIQPAPSISQASLRPQNNQAVRLVAQTSSDGTLRVANRVATRAAVRIRQNRDRQFRAAVTVNGAPVDMLVDTGASLVLLRQGDARAIGIDIDRLAFSVPVRTANGTAYAARIKLRELRIGPVSIGNVEALIAKPGTLHRSLLGMSFLSRLRSYEFTGRYLTLRM
ncbi:MAG: TIGR02281 family clan AA aspartic protease [Pseudomonadota bacterium]